MARKSGPKKVKIEVLPMKGHEDLYRLLVDLVKANHEHLSNARIALAWHMGWKADTDGRLALGKCVKAAEVHRQAHRFDFIILLNRPAWDLFDEKQRRALLDHELTHADVARDKDGLPLGDELGRTVYRIRKHDVEEFASIIKRHGCWKSDLAQFVRLAVEKDKATLFAQAAGVETNGARTAGGGDLAGTR